MNIEVSVGNSILQICLSAARSLTERAGNSSDFRHSLQRAYEDVLMSAEAVQTAAQADRLFTKVMDMTPADELALRRFVHGWQDTHVSSDLVGQLALRLHAIGAHETAGDMMAVIAADIGAEGGKPHRDLFETFANGLCAPQSWRGRESAVLSCTEFRRYLRAARIEAPETEAVLTTAASEIWNVGEYTTLSERFPVWMRERMRIPSENIRKINAYVHVHAGKTELTHFLVAIDAWDKLAVHLGEQQSVTLAATTMQRYLGALGVAYGGLADCLEQEQEKQCVRDVTALIKPGVAASSLCVGQ